ncbi:MAG: hypothetical protein IJ121_07870 [Eubacterium sp.]|nr:hypothetical protein [Eubacterium sp.]
MKVIKICSFSLLAVLMIFVLTRLFTPAWTGNWDYRKSFESFYRLEDDSVDVLAIGASYGGAAVDSYQLYEEHGYSAYNLFSVHQTMVGHYYWAKEALQTQHPKVLLLETSYMRHEKSQHNENIRKSYDCMHWGPNKIAYALALRKADELSSRTLSYLFPLYLYHTRWAELDERDYEIILGDVATATRGFAMRIGRYGTEAEPYNGITVDASAEPVTSDNNRSYLKRIIQLCRENGTEPVLYTTCTDSWSPGAHNAISEIANQYEVPYIDFNESALMQEIGLEYASDVTDDAHINYFGAKKVTGYLGSYLEAHYDIPDRRNDAAASAELAAGLPGYHYEQENAERLFVTDPAEYFAEETDSRYLVIAAGKGFSEDLSAEQKEQLRMLGLSDAVIESDWKNSCYLIMTGAGSDVEQIEETEEETFLSLYDTPEGCDACRITVSPYSTSVKIKEQECAAAPDTLNIILYDTYLGETADKIALYASDGHFVITR